MEELLIILGYTSIGWVIVEMLSSILHKFNVHILDHFLCIKCITFQLTLILSKGDIFVAATASLLAHLLDTYLLRDEIKL